MNKTLRQRWTFLILKTYDRAEMGITKVCLVGKYNEKISSWKVVWARKWSHHIPSGIAFHTAHQSLESPFPKAILNDKLLWKNTTFYFVQSSVRSTDHLLSTKTHHRHHQSSCFWPSHTDRTSVFVWSNILQRLSFLHEFLKKSLPVYTKYLIINKSLCAVILVVCFLMFWSLHNYILAFMLGHTG